MLVCNRCGTKVESCDLNFVTEPHGERHRKTVCRCGGNFVPATKCDVCGEWFDNDGKKGICEVCLEDHETVGDALEMGKNNTIKVEINGFIASVLEETVINEILTKWIEENITDHHPLVVDFCEDDKGYFEDYIRDKVGK